MSQHAKRSPSGFSQWGNCAGSVAFVDQLIADGKLPEEEEENEYAAEGTAAHELAEKSLKKGEHPSYFMDEVIKTDKFSFVVDDDMVMHIESYIEYAKQFVDLKTAQYEDKLPLFYSPEENGTADIIGFGLKTKTLHVIDLKYGKGVEVYAEGNMQLLIYGISAYDQYEMLFDIEKVCVHIAQPRLNSYTSEEYTLKQVEDHRGKILLDFEDSCLSGALEPGESQRRWCRAKPFCSKNAEDALETVGFENLDAEAPNPMELSEEKLQLIFERGTEIKKYIDSVFGRLEEETLAGKDRSWCKLVAGRSSRKWSGDEDEIVKVLRKRLTLAEVFPPKIISPAQIEKLMTKKKCRKEFTDNVNSFIVKTEGSAKLAPASDKRPAITLKNDFEDLDECETGE